MNKINIDGVLIVEGKSDVSYLSSFLNAKYFITNGYDLSEEKIAFLKEISKKNKLIIFTDNDEAGEKIRNRLKSQIDGVFEAKSRKITKNFSIKSGVAETVKEEILDSLKQFIADSEPTRYNYDLLSLITLNKNPERARYIIIKNYRLIGGNNKSLENQLNLLNITPTEIKELINGNL